MIYKKKKGWIGASLVFCSDEWWVVECYQSCSESFFFTTELRPYVILYRGKRFVEGKTFYRQTTKIRDCKAHFQVHVFIVLEYLWDTKMNTMEITNILRVSWSFFVPCKHKYSAFTGLWGCTMFEGRMKLEYSLHTLRTELCKSDVYMS